MILIGGGGGRDLWDSGPLFSCQLKPQADFPDNTGQLCHRRVNTTTAGIFTFYGALPELLTFLLTQEQQIAPPPPPASLQARLLASTPHS